MIVRNSSANNVYYYSIFAVSFIYYALTQAKQLIEQPTEPSMTAILYMAADNDLYPFVGRNITQMQAVFAKFNEKTRKQVKIAIHIDMHRPGQPKLSKRFFIDKNNLMQVGTDMCMDSGDPQTLVDCCRWAVENFPSNEYALFLWNHGFGIIEPPIKHAINPAQLFRYNPDTKLIELNRSIGFLDFVSSQAQPQQVRSICFDDTTGNYLTNIKLKEALNTICTRYLHGKKFAILACDACLMSMIEVVSPLKEYVEFFVASQEVELGTGYNYQMVFTPFVSSFLDKRSFANHLVHAYQKTYSKITQDYTQSAIDMSQIHLLDQVIDQLAIILIDGLKKQVNGSVKSAIRLSKHKNFCTHFDEPTYIDFGHFCSNLQTNLANCHLHTTYETTVFKQQLSQNLQQALDILKNVVIANTAGRNLIHARGLSIYFPENHIHSSYRQSAFATQTHWLTFLTHYLSA